ncbi:MAG: DUF58 domain-containing protein [Acidobacteria bacterium]|nr:DUF58 domain-containing protein [Acidobacteriota bacterium]
MIVPSNRLLVSAAAIVLPAAALAGYAPALAPAAWGAIAVWTLAAGVDAWRGTRRLRALSASAPAELRMTRDVAAPVTFALDNLSGAALPLRLAPVVPETFESDRPVVEVTAPAGASRVEWTCRGGTRGDRILREVWLETCSPFALWQARAARQLDCTLRVYPNLRDRATSALFLRAMDPGTRLRRQRGKGKEFENLRHYLPGDSFEDVHWKATARRAFPMVKQYSIEHAQEVYAVIDASRLSARAGILDRYVDAALHLALIAERQHDRFGLVTFADRTGSLVRARGGSEQFRVCREAIYRLQPRRVSPDFREVFTTLQTSLRRRALLVFFTSLDDALLAETFERDVALLARRHLVLVHVMPGPEARPLFERLPADTEAVWSALSGQLAWNRMRRLQIALQNRGVRLSFVDADRIKTQVANAYLEVKRRQAL